MNIQLDTTMNGLPEAVKALALTAAQNGEVKNFRSPNGSNYLYYRMKEHRFSTKNLAVLAGGLKISIYDAEQKVQFGFELHEVKGTGVDLGIHFANRDTTAVQIVFRGSYST